MAIGFRWRFPKLCFTRNSDQLCFDCGLEPSIYCHSLSDFEADLANYQKQVVDLVDSIQAIAQGQEGLRIDTIEKDQELLLIAETTNDMLDRLEKNIHDIYQLELSQKMPICEPCRRKSTLTSCTIRWSSCACTQLCRVKMS